MIEVTEVSIAELRAALESGRTTAVELVKAYLARIEAYDGPNTPTQLNAVVVHNPDALKEAEASDARRARGETLSPLDGIGPKEIGLHKLMERASDGVVQEVILATNFNAEGEATAHVLSEALKSRGLHVTRLARGVPIGSELEYVDLGTIAHALSDRR